jgi:DNA (cytosine-5)-methyltransferase 1
MLSNQYLLGIADELVIDLFAGGGGASTGIEQAIGRHVDIAINHDPEAVSLHAVNHPQTRHFCEDVFAVDPLAVTEGQAVGLLWASPDCKHFSKAKGGKPVSKNIRGLAWVVIKWVQALKPTNTHPRQIYLENVEEFQDWGPLADDGLPCPIRKGKTFRAWKAQLVNLGYVVEHRELRACDYGAPTSRKRLFLIARRDGQPIVWPKATHAQKPAKGSGLKAWRTAADCIDWSLLCPSIFERQRELAPATMRRIAHGIKRYVLDAAKPFIVPVTHQGDNRVHGIDEPVRTITTAKRGEFALCSPTLATIGYGEREGQAPRVQDINKPLGTVVGAKKHALVAAFMAQHNTGVVGHHMGEPVSTIVGKGCTQALVSATLIDAAHGEVSPTGVKRWGKGHRDIEAPAPTVTASGGNSALVTSSLVKLRGTSNSAAADAPLGTVSAGGQHHAEVRAFLVRYFGTDQDPRITDPLATVTTKHRDAVVTVTIDGAEYAIADIGMRMLQPRELYRAQGFPDSYIIDHGINQAGERVALTKGAQVRMCGNSVSPPVAAALVRANYADSAIARRAA